MTAQGRSPCSTSQQTVASPSPEGQVLWQWQGEARDLLILRDTKLIEVFINVGEHVITCWYRD